MNFNRSRRRQFVLVARQTDRQTRRRKEKGEKNRKTRERGAERDEEKKWLKGEKVEEGRDSERYFFYLACIKLFRYLTRSQVEFLSQRIVQRPFAFFSTAISIFSFVRKGQESYHRLRIFTSSKHNSRRQVRLQISPSSMASRLWWTGSIGGADSLLMWSQPDRASHSPATNERRSALLPAFKRQWKGRCLADQGCTGQGLCDRPCTAYERFTTRTLMAGDTMDVFLAALKKLAVLLGELHRQTFIYAFVAELPASVNQLLRASRSIKATPIEHLLERARTIVRG